MAAVRHCPSWADLHPELVALVLKRLPRHADRVRLGAVCRAWRGVVQQEPLPPSLPWLTLLDGSFLSVPDGEIHRMRVPGDVSIHGSVGRWLFLRRCLSGELLLMNHFSKLIVPLPIEANVSPVDSTILFLKLVPLSFSALDLLPDCLFAVLVITTTERWYTSAISICRRSSAAATATTFRVSKKYIDDIACFNGKLYALSDGELFILKIVSSHEGNPRISSMIRVANAVQDHRTLCRLTEDDRYEGNYRNYLVKSRGKLLRVRRLVGWLSDLQRELRMERTRTLSFEVFEFDDSGHKWRRLYTLGNQTLFIGPNSKSLTASKHGALEDCIYFICDYDHENWMAHPLRDCGVFNMRNGRITPLLLDGTVVQRQGRRGCATWFFPPKAM